MTHFNNCVQIRHMCPQGVCVYVSVHILYSVLHPHHTQTNGSVVIGLWQLVVKYRNLPVTQFESSKIQTCKVATSCKPLCVRCHLTWRDRGKAGLLLLDTGITNPEQITPSGTCSRGSTGLPRRSSRGFGRMYVWFLGRSRLPSFSFNHGDDILWGLDGTLRKINK